MFGSFMKIGAFTIGGGYAMLPLMEKEFVERRKWVSKDEIVDVFAVVQSIPGVIAINASIYIGYKVGGLAGACLAAAGMIIPSFTIILVIAVFLATLQDNQYVQKAFRGVQAGVTALICLTGYRLARTAVKGWLGIALAILSFIALVVFDVHAIIVIVACGLLGCIAYGIGKAKKR